MSKAPRWEPTPTADDYAAGSFTHGPVTLHRANNLSRSSGLPLLPTVDPEVVKDLKKFKKGAQLSPVLIVRGSLGRDARALTVPHGYHRICASYHLDPDAEVPCQIVDRPS